MDTASFSQQLRWIRQHMTRTNRAVANLPELKGMRLACSLHLDVKMVPFVAGLVSRGAELFVVTCNRSTVRDDVVEEMRRHGAQVEAWTGMPEEAYYTAIDQAVAWRPTHLCEMGADLSYALSQVEPPWALAGGVQASLEATGSGINRLMDLDLPYPVFNWDDLPVKEGLHNRHMVGITTWQAYFARTQLSLHEKRVLVVGYGSVGWGVAAMAKAYGGTVIVAEKDPARRLEASYDGWSVQPLEEAIPIADVIVTVTGAKGVISAEYLDDLQDGVFLLNCGHRDDEIDVAALRAFPVEQMLPHVEAFSVKGKTVYLLAGGAMFNLTAGQGDSLNAFDITLAVLISAVGYVAGGGMDQPPGIHILPRHVWQKAVTT